jgi:hypothetical protein
VSAPKTDGPPTWHPAPAVPFRTFSTWMLWGGSFSLRNLMAGAEGHLGLKIGW